MCTACNVAASTPSELTNRSELAPALKPTRAQDQRKLCDANNYTDNHPADAQLQQFRCKNVLNSDNHNRIPTSPISKPISHEFKSQMVHATCASPTHTHALQIMFGHDKADVFPVHTQNNKN